MQRKPAIMPEYSRDNPGPEYRKMVAVYENLHDAGKTSAGKSGDDRSTGKTSRLQASEYNARDLGAALQRDLLSSEQSSSLDLRAG